MTWESRLQFRVVDGRYEKDRILALNQKQIDLGRLPRDYKPTEHELLFREPTLSRVHATLTWKAFQGGYSLEHKSDVNPTLVNGEPIKKMLLLAGDRIQMGLLILELEEADKGRPYPCRQESRAEIQRESEPCPLRLRRESDAGSVAHDFA